MSLRHSVSLRVTSSVLAVGVLLASSLLATTAFGTPPTPPVETEVEPARHFHDYWGGRSEVAVFDGTLSLEPSLPDNSGCRVLGSRDFDLESDGDDVQFLGDPINRITGKADAIFSGADRIDVTLTSLNLAIPESLDLFLRFQPAYLNFFLPENGCGLRLQVGQTLQLPLARSWTDQAHSYELSEWKFSVKAALVAFGAPLPSHGLGSFHLEMAAHNSGEIILDPAHPDLFGSLDERDLGCVSQHTSPQVTASITSLPPPLEDVAVGPNAPLTGITFPFRNIVPLMTGSVDLRLSWTNDQVIGVSSLDLWYHGPHDGTFQRLELNEPNGHYAEYRVYDLQGETADPPYEDTSHWEFLLVPRLDLLPAFGPASAGAFAGTFTLCGSANKAP